MFENNYPLFNSGRLLKIEMLEELRDFPREFFDIRLKEYSDGIISGCDIDVTDNYIIIKKGIIKYQDILYLLKEDKKIAYECNNKMMILKVKFLPQLGDHDFINYSTEIYLDESLELKENELELCRFKLRVGAKLRVNHVDFIDLCTEYDTVNTINVPYAAYGESSLNPDILRSFGRELLECNVSEAWDISFAMTCIQSKEPIQKEIILRYLIHKLSIKMKNYSNEEIYNYLLNVLNSAKNGHGNNRHVGNGRFKKILID
ncbi:hypothetical protein [Clostridium aciditolerans]|uniref:DNA and RNA helicase n=1 Tax=Clostridium aciditolerans TaxID=339861 RepID=A0A934M376_9CLOT|nr:hypothetical protein [Clostridium aciditolerans]MBI6871333.1 hypothetical protein [Clostridium aciditolerans]